MTNIRHIGNLIVAVTADGRCIVIGKVR